MKTSLALATLVTLLASPAAFADIPPRNKPVKPIKLDKTDKVAADKPIEPEERGNTLMRRVGPVVSRDANGRLVVADHPGLRDPSQAADKAPDHFRVRLVTTRGPITIAVHRTWAPNAADRFYNLVQIGFFNDIGIFRVIQGFMAQFGIHGDPDVAAIWRQASITDDPVVKSNTRGMVTFATAGPDTRTTQMFVNYGDNSRLDGMGFSPFGVVESGMNFVDAFYNEYGEGAPTGKGPDQGRVQSSGNTYLREKFGQLDFIVEAELLGEHKAMSPATKLE